MGTISKIAVSFVLSTIAAPCMQCSPNQDRSHARRELECLKGEIEDAG